LLGTERRDPSPRRIRPPPGFLWPDPAGRGPISFRAAEVRVGVETRSRGRPRPPKDLGSDPDLSSRRDRGESDFGPRIRLDPASDPDPGRILAPDPDPRPGLSPDPLCDPDPDPDPLRTPDPDPRPADPGRTVARDPDPDPPRRPDPTPGLTDPGRPGPAADPPDPDLGPSTDGPAAIPLRLAAARCIRACFMRLTVRRRLIPMDAAPITIAPAAAIPAAGPAAEATPAPVTATVLTAARAAGAAGTPLVLARRGLLEATGAVVGVPGPVVAGEAAGGATEAPCRGTSASCSLLFDILVVTSCDYCWNRNRNRNRNLTPGDPP
jgi:hypothetical protein